MQAHTLIHTHAYTRTRSITDKMAATIDPAKPWAHRNAAEWDRMTVAEFTAAECWTRGARHDETVFA